MLAALAVFAAAAQAFVLFATVVMGLGWGGLTYVAALLQAGLAFVVISWLARRRLDVVVLVPVVSAALTAGLAFAGQAHGRATACGDQERAAARPCDVRSTKLVRAGWGGPSAPLAGTAVLQVTAEPAPAQGG